MRTIFFAGGCFWGTEHYLSLLDGVVETTVGYANGNVENPSYQQVYTDMTGHVECVKVKYDDEIMTLETLCRLFFRSIDPLLENRQGNDIGTRYRTGIYWTDDYDRHAVETVYTEVRNKYGKDLAVEIMPLKCFYPAEEYHQEYLVKNPDGYCHLTPQLFRTARTYTAVRKVMRDKSVEEKRNVLQRFFKTGKGEYGEGDRFLGVVVPEIRKVAKMFKDASYDVLEVLLESEWHEVRLCALLILREKYNAEPERVVEFYLAHTGGINNWDLVDLSAPYVLGRYLVDKEDRSVLYELADSYEMWHQRIAVVATLMLIRNGLYDDTFRLAEMMLQTRYDLMQKAVGWMLREVGKRDQELLCGFLDIYGRKMPRTMLRYAIERFPADIRRYYLTK